MAHLDPPQVSATSVPLKHYRVTLLLIALNLIYFAYYSVHGVSLYMPSTMDGLTWGADTFALSMGDQPFRLISSLFFHWGLLHLAMNMWALYVFGQVAELLWGSRIVLLLFFATGLAGNLLSHAYELYRYQHFHDLASISGGASGAIMGLAAALTLWSLCKPLASQSIRLSAKPLVLVMGINLLIGWSISGINQAAHLGGMLMGLLLAACLYFLTGRQYTKAQQIRSLSLLAVVILGLIYGINRVIFMGLSSM